MNYAYDAEFLEDGYTIDLISIGIVAEDGREFYAVNSDFDYPRLAKNDWMMENVISSLPSKVIARKWQHDGSWRWKLDTSDTAVKPAWVIRNEIRAFITEESREDVELWADYCAYDHVVLCQLFGTMMNLPSNIPMFTNDIQQLWRAKGRPELPEQTGTAHNALEDARHGMKLLKFLPPPPSPGDE